MNKKELSSAPVAIGQYGVHVASYKNQKTGEYEIAETEKAVKFYVVSDKYPMRRINFYLPKAILVFQDGTYSHIKYHGIKILRLNMSQAIEQTHKKWKDEESNFNNRRAGGSL